MYKVLSNAKRNPYISSWIFGMKGMELPNDDTKQVVELHLASE